MPEKLPVPVASGQFGSKKRFNNIEEMCIKIRQAPILREAVLARMEEVNRDG